jgi:hypothetical protein
MLLMLKQTTVLDWMIIKAGTNSIKSENRLDVCLKKDKTVE